MPSLNLIVIQVTLKLQSVMRTLNKLMLFIRKRDYEFVNFRPEDIWQTVAEVPMQCDPSVREDRDVRLADCS